jgi:hypothetical protein
MLFWPVSVFSPVFVLMMAGTRSPRSSLAHSLSSRLSSSDEKERSKIEDDDETARRD